MRKFTVPTDVLGRYFAIFVAVAIVVQIAPIAVAVTSAHCPLQVGKPYKSPDSSAVFVVTEGCEKRPVFNPEVYFSHFASWAETTQVDKATLASVKDSTLYFLPWGRLRKFSNGSLLKTVSDPKVYLISGGHAYPFDSEQAFASLGYAFVQVEDVTDDVMAAFERHPEPIRTADDVPDALVFKYPEDARVFVVRTEQGKRVKYHLSTMEQLRALGRTDRIAVLPKSKTFDDAVSSGTLPAPAPEHVHMPTPAPAPEHVHTPAPTPVPAPAVVVAPAPTVPAGMSGSMPYVDVSTIPAGNPGSDKVRIISLSPPPTPGDVGAFRTVCGLSHMNFDDPLVYPGVVGASHLHQFFGNTKTDANLKPGHLRDIGANSTCGGGTVNLSAYWVPALVDAKGKVIKARNIGVYYKSGYGGVAPADIREFPEGLRMIGGNPKSSGPQDMVSWNCLEHNIGMARSIPLNCPGGPSEEIVMTVHFPQCWNGKDLDSPDHRSHMSDTKDGGGCPSSHPVPIPAITFNVVFPMPPEGPAGMRLVSDMYDKSIPGGYSAHADWWDGWDHAIVKKWIKNCINPSMNCYSGMISETEFLDF